MAIETNDDAPAVAIVIGVGLLTACVVVSL
jgi:hypothetical protein